MVNASDIHAFVASPDLRAMVLALALAAIAIYLGNVAGNIVEAIADEGVGYRREIGDHRKSADLARKPEFILLLVTAAIAGAGGAWSTSIPLCLAGLSIARLPKYIAMWPRAVEIRAEWQVLLAVTVSTTLSLVSAVGMVAIGKCAGWLVR